MLLVKLAVNYDDTLIKYGTNSILITDLSLSGKGGVQIVAQEQRSRYFQISNRLVCR